MSGAKEQTLFRVCVKFYAREPHRIENDAELFVPIFHEWIRDRALDLVLLDVADYAHAPVSPGIMLIAYEASFALDRSDGRLGLLAQRRTPIAGGGAADAIATTLRQALQVAALLEADPRVAEKLTFDAARVRIEANDRLLAPNTDEGFAAFEPAVRAAAEEVFGVVPEEVARVENDPRDRLTIEIDVPGVVSAREHADA